MNYKKRILADKLCRLVEHFSVVVVCGARQVGKSTLLSHLFSDWDTVVFDPVVDIGNARADPELFLSNHPVPLILDEIQYSPEVVSCIKRSVDRNKRPGMYILTGSQQWSVIKSISESLAGRAVFLDLEGFSLSEINEVAASPSWLERYLDDPHKFVTGNHSKMAMNRTLYEQLWTGWLPEMDSIAEDLASDYFAAYIRTYIERDVRQLLDVIDWQQFGRFVQLMAALSAQEINFSQLGRDIGITPQTAKRWLTVLKATFQWYEIPAYHGNSIKKISSKPKGYFADSGLACHLGMISSATVLGGHPFTGAMFETAIVAEIRKLILPLSRKAEIYHWRLHSGSEVDILLERDNILYPIEIKLKSRPSRKDTSGISALRDNYSNRNIAPGLVISPTETFEQLTDTDYALPWNTL
ncbi:MAG: ATP-binding protein [Kiritimatiellae bacterium]|nr:ATP-binding protein [Kiritimatiellia bacterium]